MSLFRDRRFGFRALLAAGCLCAAGVASADWSLVPDASTVTFVTVKNGVIAESHRFDGLQGSVDDAGAHLVIELASVDTLIPIRDERMREMLFEVTDFPEARFDAPVSEAALEGMAVGDVRRLEVTGTLSVHGATQQVGTTLLATRAGADRVVVATTRSVIVSADALGYGEGVERLRAVAGLNSITPMVPVNLVLTFARNP
jgi:polyisoprenoid-binding protein YceI